MNSPRAMAAQKRCTTSLTIRSENCAIDPLLSSPHVYPAARRDESSCPALSGCSSRQPATTGPTPQRPLRTRLVSRDSPGGRARGRAGPGAREKLFITLAGYKQHDLLLLQLL